MIVNKFIKEVRPNGCFIFFNEYEENRFDEFVLYATTVLEIAVASRFEGPYSSVVNIEYFERPVSLTSCPFDGCYMRLGLDDEAVSNRIMNILN